MLITVDATGCACPEPVIRTKKAMKEKYEEITVLVDNKFACENVKRLADKHGYKTIIEESDGIFELKLKR